MRNEITIHQPKTQTHLPDHELAARKDRAALLTPKPEAPKPPERQPGRKTWYEGA